MKLAIAASIFAVLIVLFLLLPDKDGEQQQARVVSDQQDVQNTAVRSSNTNDRPVSQGSQERRELDRKRENLLEDLRAASSPQVDAQRLLEILAEIKGTPMLLDEDVLSIYRSVVSAFSVDDLVILANMWPTEFEDTNMMTAQAISQFSEIARVFRERDDADQFRAFMDGVASDHKFRGEMLYKAAQSMSIFSPSTLVTYLGSFSDSDKVEIARGLVARMKMSSVTKGERVDLMQQYLVQVRDPELYGPFVRLYLEETAKDDPKAMLDWVRNHGNPDLAAAWDEPVIRALVKDHPKDASEYVNEILAKDDISRANQALEYMIREYSEIDPASALSYVLELPEEAAITDQMVADPFTRLIKSDRDQAEKIMNEMEDPRIKEMLVGFWDAVKELE